MPELTPEMEREIDKFIAWGTPDRVSDIEDWLAAQRAEIAALKAFLEREGYRRCDIATCNCGSWHEGAWKRRFDEVKAERDALERVARAARDIYAWEIDPEGNEGVYEAAMAALEKALAAPEVQALLGVDSPSGASHPPDRPTKDDDVDRSAR